MKIREPEIIQDSFGSGVQLVFSNIPHSKTLSIGILVGAGSFTEEEKSMGYSHFLEHMLFKGTQRLDFEMLSKEFEKCGAYVNAFTGKYYTLFYVHTLEEFSEHCLNLLLEMVFESTLPEKEIEKEKKVVLEEISSYKDSPEDYLLEEFYAKTFPHSFFGYPILGNPNTIRHIGKEELFLYYKRHYTPQNMVISVAGKFSQADILDQLENFFSKKSFPKNISPIPRTRIPIPFRIQHKTHHKADLEQAYICLGFRPQKKMKSRQLLKLFNVILGGVSSSRLYTEIREKRALCYGIDSSLYFDPNIEFFNIFASTRKNQLSELVDVIEQELKRFRETPISEEELTIAKNQLKTRMVFRQENVSQTMLMLASQAFFYQKTLSDQKILEKIEKTCLEDFFPLYENLTPDTVSLHTLVSKP